MADHSCKALHKLVDHASIPRDDCPGSFSDSFIPDREQDLVSLQDMVVCADVGALLPQFLTSSFLLKLFVISNVALGKVFHPMFWVFSCLLQGPRDKQIVLLVPCLMIDKGIFNVCAVGPDTHSSIGHIFGCFTEDCIFYRQHILLNLTVLQRLWQGLRILARDSQASRMDVRLSTQSKYLQFYRWVRGLQDSSHIVWWCSVSP